MSAIEKVTPVWQKNGCAITNTWEKRIRGVRGYRGGLTDKGMRPREQSAWAGSAQPASTANSGNRRTDWPWTVSRLVSLITWSSGGIGGMAPVLSIPLGECLGVPRGAIWARAVSRAYRPLPPEQDGKVQIIESYIV